MNFKVGDLVRIVKKPATPGSSPGFEPAMGQYKGKVAKITHASDADYGQSIKIDLDDEVYWWSARWLTPAKESKAQKSKRLAAEKCAAVAAAKAKAAADAAAAKAKAMRATVLAALSDPARKAMEYLDANPGAFGCQREHVLAIVAALTGCELPAPLTR